MKRTELPALGIGPLAAISLTETTGSAHQGTHPNKAAMSRSTYLPLIGPHLSHSTHSAAPCQHPGPKPTPKTPKVPNLSRPGTPPESTVLCVQIKSMEQIYLFSLPVKEHQIVEQFLGGALKDEVMKIMPVQKQTRAGQRTRFKAFVIVGDHNGHCGLGVKCAKEVATAIRGAIIAAKMAVIPIRRGYWGNKIGKPHTVPAKMTGKCGSVTVRLIPAPRGAGATPCIKSCGCCAACAGNLRHAVCGSLILKACCRNARPAGGSACTFNVGCQARCFGAENVAVGVARACGRAISDAGALLHKIWVLWLYLTTTIVFAAQLRICCAFAPPFQQVMSAGAWLLLEVFASM